MLSYDRRKNNPRVLRALTSLTPEEFDTLLMPFEQAWQAYVSTHSWHKASRQRRDGGGRKPRLGTIEDTWLCMLFYCQGYPLQEVSAQVFGMSQGRANAWRHTRSPLWESARGAAHCFPERNPQPLEHVLALGVSVDCTLDGTERPVHRPTAPVEQQEQYRGKKKTPGETPSHRRRRRTSGARLE